MDYNNLPIGGLNRYLYTDSLLRKTSAYLCQPVTSIRHQNQMKLEVDEDVVYYTFCAWAIMAEDCKDLLLTCTLRFESDKGNETANNSTNCCGAGCALSVIDSFDMNQEPYVRQKRYGVAADQHLIPDLYDDKRREEKVERVLSRYCPEALTTSIPVSIHSIMGNKMQLTVVTDIQLFSETYGQILFKDDEQLVMSSAGDDIMAVPYRRGTVLIDGEKVFLYGMDFAHYTIAHEAYHWFSHRMYVDFHRLLGVSAKSSYNGSSRYSSSDILEIQANAIASCILMPRDMFLKNTGNLLRLMTHLT